MRWLGQRVHKSPRCSYQWNYVLRAELPVLNIGSGDDELKFGDYAVHLDRQYFEGHRWFAQADAYALPFMNQSFQTVILGDILEHLENPRKAIEEAARVSRDWVVMTIFEEWRLLREGLNPPDPKFSGHCWCFTDKMVDELTWVPGFRRYDFKKVAEVEHEGHLAYNWLVAIRREN